jgi:uncharacterized protein (TIGR02266 family)
MVERRGAVRAVAKIEVFRKEGPVSRVPLYVSGNVSAGGLFLITQEPFEPGTDLIIKFSLPKDNNKISAVGSVVWKRESREAKDLKPGMGVKFIEITNKDQEKIRTYVASLAEDD